jgi:pimeloyl-ACP methyl ester carboxylesterase
MMYLLHGGSGTNSGLESLAEEFGAQTPLQRCSGGEPQTVARHVVDERVLVSASPVLVGHLGSAMLALCYAAEHPAECLLLVNCGTFDEASRAEFVRRREALSAERPFEEYDMQGQKEMWGDRLRLQRAGTYQARFARIDASVTILQEIVRRSSIGIEIVNCGRLAR